jgi:hypothetical protein
MCRWRPRKAGPTGDGGKRTDDREVGRNELLLASRRGREQLVTIGRRKGERPCRRRGRQVDDVERDRREAPEVLAVPSSVPVMRSVVGGHVGGQFTSPLVAMVKEPLNGSDVPPMAWV